MTASVPYTSDSAVATPETLPNACFGGEGNGDGGGRGGGGGGGDDLHGIESTRVSHFHPEVVGSCYEVVVTFVPPWP